MTVAMLGGHTEEGGRTEERHYALGGRVMSLYGVGRSAHRLNISGFSFGNLKAGLWDLTR